MILCLFAHAAVVARDISEEEAESKSSTEVSSTQDDPQADVCTLKCVICFDEVDAEDYFSLLCRHWFCRSCWIRTIEVGVGDRQVTMPCPAGRCAARVPTSMVEFLCPMSVVKDHRSNVLRLH